MLSIQKISKAAAKGYAEYIEEQKEEAQQIMAADPTVRKEEAERRAARIVVERVARRDGEDVAEALQQFDRRQESEQVGAQVGYYSLTSDEELTGERLLHVVGDKAGERVEPGALKEMLLMRDSEGNRLDDGHPKQIAQLAREAGVNGTPTAEQLAALRHGIDPFTGSKLKGKAAALHARAYAAQALRDKAVTGVDLTFSAPKSLSIYAAAAATTGDMARYEAVLDAHRQAIEDTLAQAEADGLICARRGKQGAERMAAKLTGGVVKIETGSRALDPQLHGHTVLSSVVEAADGRRSIIDSKVLFDSSKYLGVAFRRHLGHRIGERLGLQFDVDELGMHELVGFDEELIRKFSTRSAEIAETLSEMDAADEALRNAVEADKPAHRQAFDKQQARVEALMTADSKLTQARARARAVKELSAPERQKAKTYGQYLKLDTQSTAARRQDATVQSRRGKDGTEAELIEHWSQNDALTAEVIQQADEHSLKHSRGPVREDELFTFVGQYLTAVDGQQSFSEKEARIAIAQFAPMHWDQQRVKLAADRFLDSADHVVRLQLDKMNEPKLASWTNDVRRFSTPQIVATQERIMRTADKLADRKPRLFIDYAKLAEAAESYTLTEQQAEFNAAATATDLTLVRGYAGTGKSWALKPLCEQLQAAGYDVSTFGVKKEQSYDLAREIGANRGESLMKLLMRSTDDPSMPYPGLLESGRWAQGETEQVRAERRALQKAAREAGNRARSAVKAGDEKAQRKAEAEQAKQAKAQKRLDAFGKERAADPTKRELATAWDKHLRMLKVAKMLPHGTARQIAMHQLAQQRKKLAEAKAFAADVTEEINWDKPQCWIIDEAALLADHELDRLIQAADDHNIKLIFLGDREQGKAIGVSGAYAQLEDTYGTVSLTEIQRAKAGWERELQMKFHELPRDPDAAEKAAREIIAEYEQHDRIEYITKDDVQSAVAAGQADADDTTVATELGVQRGADWYMEHRGDGTACVQTATRVEQAAVAEAVQQKLIDAGELDPNAKTVELPLDDKTSVHGRVGEPILIRQNLNKVGLRNGMTGEITQIRRDGSIQLRVTDGDKVLTQSVTRDQLRTDNAVTLLYASTVTKEQGSTFDRTAVLVPADRGLMSKGDLYTALSRGRHENTAIVSTMQEETVARERLVKSVQNRQEDEALQVDYINNPITREEIEQEKAYGAFGDDAIRNVRDQRRIDLHRNRKQRAETQRARRKAEAVATQRVQRERELARLERQAKRQQRGVSILA